MVDFLSPGTKVVQRRKGPVVLPSIATAIGGFMVYTEKGPVGKPILVTGEDDAEEQLGGRITSPGNGRLADSLQDFFGQGGASCYIMRYIGSGSDSGARNLSTTGGATSGALSSDDGAFPATLSPGDTFLGSVDGVAQGTVTIAATQATKTGSSATYAQVANGAKLTFSIAGIPGNQEVTFDGTEDDQPKYLAQLNAQSRGCRWVAAGGEVRCQTDVYGSSAAGNIVSGGTGVLAALGLTAGAFTNAGPNNVATVDAVTAEELADLFNATFTGTGGKSSTTTVNEDEDGVTWTTDAEGSSSSVQLTSGTGVSKIAGFDTSAHAGTNSSTIPTIALVASSPGTWSNIISTKVTKNDIAVTSPAAVAAGSKTSLTLASTARLAIGDTVSITKGGDTQRGVIKLINGLVITFVAAITVPGGGYDGSEEVVLETFDITAYDAEGSVLFPSPFRNLRMSELAGISYFVNAINSAPRAPFTAANLDAVADDPRPATDSSPVFLTGGLDGAAPTAQNVIDLVPNWDQAMDVNEISCPGAATDFPGPSGVSILKAIESYINRRQDLMAIVDLPKSTPATGSGGVKDWIQNTANLASSYEAAFWPWPKRLDSASGVLQAFPPSPFIQGIIARTHATRNFGKAPAGIVDGQVYDIQDLETIIAENSAEYDDFYPANVNAILKFPGQGFAVWGSRTLDPTGEFGQINVQTVFNINKRIAKTKTRFVNFENNDTTTRASVVRVLTATYREQRVAGILAGERDTDAFYVICDESNNTPLVIKRGKLVTRVGLAVNSPAEFLEFTFEQDTRAVDRALAALGT